MKIKIITAKIMPNTLITAQELMESGLPISFDITEKELEQSISTVEQFYVVPRIGDLQWTQLIEHPTDYDVAINGGTTLAGLKQSEYHLVFAWVMWDRFRVTRYTSVQKDSDESTAPSARDIIDVASQHYEIGEVFLRGVLKFLQIEDNGVQNGFIFGELMPVHTSFIHKH